MKRKATILLTVTWLMLGIVLTFRSLAGAAPEAATLKSITLSANPTGTQLVLNVDGIYSYKTIQASPDTLFIDLAGAEVRGVAPAQRWTSPLLSGYRLLGYKDAAGRQVVRVQVDTKRADPFVVQTDGSNLRLLYGNSLSRRTATVPEAAAAAGETPAHLDPTMSSHRPLIVSKVTVDKQESEATFVDVSTSRSASYRVTTLPSPARLIVDIDDAQTTAVQKTYAADTAVLKTVRIGQFRAPDPSVVRVVADLNGNPAFDVHNTPAGVRIELRPRGTAKSAPLAAQVPAATRILAPRTTPTENKPAATVAPTSVAVSKPASTSAVMEKKPAAVPQFAAQVPAATQILTPRTTPMENKPVATVALALPPVAVSKPASTAAMVEKKPAAAPLSGAESRKVVTAQVQSTLPATASSKQAVAAPLPPPARNTPEALRALHAAQTLNLGNDALPGAGQGAPAANQTTVGEEAKPVYTGEPISLNLKDVDLKDFFRLIHEISGLNIIIDPDVSGSVTLVLDSVPWDQALDIVMKNSRLGKVLEGNVLRIAKLDTLTSEQESQLKLIDARINAAPMVTVFRPINYAKAQEIAVLLKTWGRDGALTRRGTVLVDVRNNTLIVSDVQSQIPIIEDIVSKIDKRAKQISIEARVVLASADFTRTLSAALSGTGRNPSTTSQFGMATGSGASITPSNSVPAAGIPRSGLIIPENAIGEFGTFAVTNASSRYLINAVIAAQEERDQAKTISRPTIVTQNNVQGMVQQGVQVPVQTTINNTISVVYQNATLQMQVTPQVTESNNIFLIINVNNASLGAVIANGNPNINTQQATTSVLVPDGGTVVFGGITVTSRSKAATYVPLLGTIPILGNLFKTSNVSDQDQELLFFVSPKILPG